MTAQPNQSLIDGLSCLQALASEQNTIGCREMARNLGLNNMRANRLLKTLADIGLAQQDEKKRYSIGPGIHALAAQSLFGSGILQQALPLLRELKHTKLTVAIGVLWRDHVTYLLHGKIGENIEDALGRVGLFPATKSSIGMLLLAEKDDVSLEELFKNNYPYFTSKEAFYTQINQIRQNGYSNIQTTGEEAHQSIAVCIGNPSIAGIALTRIPPDCNIKPYIKELHEISRRIKL